VLREEDTEGPRVTCVHNEEEGLSDLSVRAIRYPAPVHSYMLADLSSGVSRVCRVLAPRFAAVDLTHTITLSATSHHGGSHRPPTYLLHICIPRAFVRIQKRYRTNLVPFHVVDCTINFLTIAALVYEIGGGCPFILIF
jgi:hypothetical protein